MNLEESIARLKKEKKALIIAHNYQNPDVQDIADYTGDSLELSRIAAKNDADIIIFCGVYFMAESACILSPQKKVILPDSSAGCPMADMADVDSILEMKKKYPEAAIVTYINSTAAVKAMSDICVTSSNAVSVVNKLKEETILFVPDKNLAHYVQRFTSKKIIPWNGFCPTHENFTKEDLMAIKKQFPGAHVIVHPECRSEVIDLADKTLSTGQMVNYIRKIAHHQVIVGTEKGMLHKLKKISPEKEFILASRDFICPNMKKISLEKILHSLVNEEPIVSVQEDIRVKALQSLQRMLELS
ncbi:MAG TPA: quinolinate synthase NadA [Spirochaetota bacterium]|nr:quinolinate synthase NadA [Spirochaetota bacterium]HOR92898.1 quinolinate synthase NadA [Spirochaetota bacterium]HPD04559.1 quinolinate synthase NadA [Spirochaetota bacterium]HQG42800.1 quinolinate synthase NadA [Spirochaetota bacterium]HRR60761.1 quinolinate synthase NadA [Spirochaetota bacterium]